MQGRRALEDERLGSTEIATAYETWFRRAVRKETSDAGADDVAQDSLLRVLRNPAPLHTPRAWLLRVAQNIIREHRRRDAVHAPDAIHGVDIDDYQFSVDAHQEHALLLKQIVLSLPPKLQEVFVMSRFEGLTNEEIARRCGISVKTVEWRMTKALAHCADLLRN